MNLRRLVMIFCALFLLVCAVQATTLDITVEDEDGDPIEDAYIYIDDDYEGKTDDDGEFEFDHSLDDPFELKVKKTGYETWEEEIDEDEDSVTVELEKSIEEYELVIYVYDADTLYPVNDAWVEIEDEDAETIDDETDNNGKVTFDVIEETEYGIEVQDNDYITQILEVEVEDSDETVVVWLIHEDRQVFKVRDAETRDAIDGAEVFVDGSSKGLTGSGGLLFTRISGTGTHQISVVSDGYSSYSASIRLDDVDIYQLIELTLSTYPLTIMVSDSNGMPVSGATVSIDDEKMGMTDSSGEFGISDIIEGTYTVSVSKEHYVDWEETREISEKENIQITLPFVQTAVTVIVEDTDHALLSGAIVTLDGEQIGTSDGLGKLNIDLDPGAGYNFTASKEGYKSASAIQDIELGESSKTVTITLESEFDAQTLGLIVLGLAALVVVIFGARWYMQNRGGSSGRKGKKF